MTHAIALEVGQSSQGTFEPITPVWSITCDIGISTIASLVNLVNVGMETLKPV